MNRWEARTERYCGLGGHIPKFLPRDGPLGRNTKLICDIEALVSRPGIQSERFRETKAEEPWAVT